MITVPERASFAKIPQVVELPHLLEVQLESYERFLQRNVPIDRRENVGLESVFRSVFPVVSTRGEFALEYVGYAIGEPKYTVEECKERDLTFAAPLKASLRLVVRETQEGEQVIKDIIQSEVYLGEIPLITAISRYPSAAASSSAAETQPAPAGFSNLTPEVALTSTRPATSARPARSHSEPGGAGTFRSFGAPSLDAEGNVALISACRNYLPLLDGSFRRYCQLRIRKAIEHALAEVASFRVVVWEGETHHPVDSIGHDGSGNR